MNDLGDCEPMPVRTLAEVEREHIVATLKRFDGHRARAAAALGIGERTLMNKPRGYGFPPRAKFTGSCREPQAQG